MDGPAFDRLLRSLTNRASRRGLLGVFAGLTGFSLREAATPAGARKRRRVSRKGRRRDRVVVCHRARNGATLRLEVTKLVARKLAEKDGFYRFIDCCADADCQDGHACQNGTCRSTCHAGAEGETCATDDNCCSGTCACGLSACVCAVACADQDDDGACLSNRCSCATGGTPGLCTCRAERCAAPGEACDTNFDCCDGTCVCLGDDCTCDCITPGECASGHCACSIVDGFDACTCRPPGCNEARGSCADDTDCCDGPCVCTGGECACACVQIGAPCASDGACCSGRCEAGACRDANCDTEPTCQTDADCCVGFCGPGVCFAGDCDGLSCLSDADCCNGSCGGRVCVGDEGCAGRCRR